MKRSVWTAAIVTVFMIVPMPSAGATFYDDPKDSGGRFDVDYVEAGREKGFDVQVTMYKKISKALFKKGSGNKVVVLFNTDNSGGADYEGRVVKSGKRLVVKIAGSGSSFEPLKVRLVNTSTGIEFTVPLNSPPVPKTAFGIAVKTVYNGGSCSPCKDRAPNSGWIALPPA